MDKPIEFRRRGRGYDRDDVNEFISRENIRFNKLEESYNKRIRDLENEVDSPYYLFLVAVTELFVGLRTGFRCPDVAVILPLQDSEFVKVSGSGSQCGTCQGYGSQCGFCVFLHKINGGLLLLEHIQ